MPASCSHQHLVLGQAQPISELSSCRLAEPLQSPGSRRPQNNVRGHTSRLDRLPRLSRQIPSPSLRGLSRYRDSLIPMLGAGGAKRPNVNNCTCPDTHRHTPTQHPVWLMATSSTRLASPDPRSRLDQSPALPSRHRTTTPHACQPARRGDDVPRLSATCRAGRDHRCKGAGRRAVLCQPLRRPMSFPLPAQAPRSQPSTLAVARQRSEPAAQGSLGRGDEGIRESTEPHGRSEKRGRPLLLVAPVPSAGRLRPTAPSSRRKTPLPSGRVAPLPPSRVARGICCHVARAANSLPFQTPATPGQIYVVPILVRCSTLQSLLFRRATPPAASHTNQSNPTSSKSQAEPSSDTLQKASPPLPSSRVRSERSHPSEIPALDRLGTERGSPRDVDSQAPYARPA
ncbi:unnamed protein product [Diplocarpon coronariae]